MDDTEYTYHGPPSGVTLPGEGDAPDREVLFHDGGRVSLPAGNPYVAGLAAQRYLVAVDAPAATGASTAAPESTRPRPRATPTTAQETTP